MTLRYDPADTVAYDAIRHYGITTHGTRIAAEHLLLTRRDFRRRIRRITRRRR